MNSFWTWQGWPALGVIATILGVVVAVAYTVLTYLLLRTTLQALVFTSTPSLTVSASWGMPVNPVTGDTFPLIAFFRACNDGGRPVMITNLGLRLPTNETMFFTERFEATHPMPAKLEMGEHYQANIPVETIKDGLRRHGFSGMVDLTVVFTDATGRDHKGEWGIEV